MREQDSCGDKTDTCQHTNNQKQSSQAKPVNIINTQNSQQYKQQHID